MMKMGVPTSFAGCASGVKSMRVGFVTDQDPADVGGWSGINTFMSRAVAEAGAEIVPLHGFRRPAPLAALAKKAWVHLVLRRYYELRRDPGVLRRYAAQVERRARLSGVGALLSTGTHLTADCRPGCPLFFLTDATVPALFAIYPGYERFSKIGYAEALASEKRAVVNATAMIFSSDWAARSAVEDLGADPRKVHVVPCGANFQREPSRGEVLAAAAVRSREKMVLLFAGVDWRRKGGAKALAVGRALAAAGARVELHVMGVDQRAAGGDAETKSAGLTVTWHGRISKAEPEGMRRIERLFSETHFLLLPTVADCTPMVFAEANAFAVPVVTHRTGGVPTMIRDEKNGRMFSLDSSAQEQAGWMMALWRDAGRYRAMAEASRDEYESRLNWRSSATRVMALISASREKESA